MKLKINIFGILTLLFLVLPFAAIGAQDDPEAEYGKLSKTYTLNPDGSQEYRYSMELTLFTHTAMNRTYGESFIVYNPEFQELKIHSSYTKQKDGSIIETPENAFVEVLPRQAADAPAFNHLKEMVVVHTGLELGATIFLDYSVISKPGYLQELDICEPIRQTSMVKDYTITLSVPENKPLAYSLTTINANPVVKMENGKKLVSWKLQQVKAASQEPQTTGLNGDVAFLTATTYPSVKDALGAMKSQFSSSENGDLSSLSKEITKGKSSDTEKVYAILSYVSDNLSTIRLALPETGFRLRPVEDVISSAYATEAEKVNLLSGLLNAASLKAEVVAAFHPNMKVNECGLTAIQELFVMIKADGKSYYLTPKQSKISDAAMLGDYVSFVSISNAGEAIQIAPESSVLDYTYTISMLPDKAEMKVSGKVGNAFIPYTINYLDSFTEKDKDAKEEKGSGYSIFTYSISQPLKEMADHYVLFTLPDASNSLSHAAYRNYNSKRKENLLLPYPVNESFKYILELPESVRLRTPETPKTISNGVGELIFSTKVNGNTVEIVRTLKLKKQLITPADYAAFRSLMTEWGDENSRQLLFNIDSSK
jgi:hypothetical protein